MVLVLGEILFDIFPQYRRIGGAPFNFAFHLKKLGVPVRFISCVGEDEPGQRILEFLNSHGFALEDIKIDANHPSGRVLVRLDGRGMPEFDILPDVAYDYIDHERTMSLSRDETIELYRPRYGR